MNLEVHGKEKKSLPYYALGKATDSSIRGRVLGD